MSPERCENKDYRMHQQDEDVYRQISNTGYTKNLYDEAHEQMALNVKFVKPDEVDKARKQFLMLKQ